MIRNIDNIKYPILRLVLDSQNRNNIDDGSPSACRRDDECEETTMQSSGNLCGWLYCLVKTRIPAVLICALLLLISVGAHGQSTEPDTVYKRGFQIHPFQTQIGFRSNLDKKYFIDFKGGLAFTALPYFTLELNVLKRFVNEKQTKVYWGAGLSIDEFVFGLQFPLGIEFSPIYQNRQLTFIAEVAPRLSYSNSYFANIQLYPHVGVSYYLKAKQKTR